MGPAMRALARGDDERGVDLFVTAVLGREAAAAMSDTMRQQSRDNVQPFKARLRAGFPAFSAADARRIPVPALVVTGERSASVLRLIAATLAELMPRAERIDIPDASHLMYETHPEAFNAALLDFLSRHRSR
jgi:pimeloyl-ACP methyl ester carboxylesterase